MFGCAHSKSNPLRSIIIVTRLIAVQLFSDLLDVVNQFDLQE